MSRWDPIIIVPVNGPRLTAIFWWTEDSACSSKPVPVFSNLYTCGRAQLEAVEPIMLNKATGDYNILTDGNQYQRI